MASRNDSILPGGNNRKCDDERWSWGKTFGCHLQKNCLKYIAGLLVLGLVGESAYIYRLDMGLARIPNDLYDLWFGKDIGHNSPEIWDADHQSFLRHARPVPIHSHNDYKRRIPLFEALGSGCISVEADVHLRGSNLLVGHSKSSLSDDKTLQSLYLEPLQRILEAQNAQLTDGAWRGVFNHSPEQTFILVIDLKTSGKETFDEVDAQLQPLRDLDYLTYWDGKERIMRPLTVVASGNAPFSSILAMNATHRDIFWDAKLEQLVSIEDDFTTDPPKYKYSVSNSYLASTRFRNAILFRYANNSELHGETAWEKDMTSTQIEQAESRGLLARYWDTPSDPPNLREIAWRVLVDKKIGLLNMDDLGTVRARAKGWGELHNDLR
ncbi:hypothetical protein MRS44_014094 [Fusarium solani]|uniref:uncharacterized protein n=1 Tax=Fusarium solani TaxID=169388 RepID=UPI002314314C|nr:hypothetical protein MRS44_014094 [Fusarium solani]KAJ4210650.1 Altered inheritance of mitochondria protein 6 [Fusarium solani]